MGDEREIKTRALNDPDLEPLWANIGSFECALVGALSAQPDVARHSRLMFREQSSILAHLIVKRRRRFQCGKRRRQAKN